MYTRKPACLVQESFPASSPLPESKKDCLQESKYGCLEESKLCGLQES